MFNSPRFRGNQNDRTNNDYIDTNEIERPIFASLYNGFTGFGSLDNLKEFEKLDSPLPSHSYSLPNCRFGIETCIPAPVAHLPNTKSAYNMRMQSPQSNRNFEMNSDFDNCFGNFFDSMNEINNLQNVSDSTFLQTCSQYSINPIELNFTPKVFWEKYKTDHETLKNEKNDISDQTNNNDKTNNNNANSIVISSNLNFNFGEMRFDKIVTDFFRSEEQEISFPDKFNNCIKLIKFSKLFVPLVGLDYANDYVIKVNIKCFSRLIGIKDGACFLFNQNGVFNKLGLNEISDTELDNFNDHINLEGVDFVNTKLIYHPNKLFAKSASFGEN